MHSAYFTKEMKKKRMQCKFITHLNKIGILFSLRFYLCYNMHVEESNFKRNFTNKIKFYITFEIRDIMSWKVR